MFRDEPCQSAAEFEQDIGHFLGGEAILVRPPSATYQLRIFARRHRALVVGVVAMALALVLGVIGTTNGMLRANRTA